MKQEDKELLLKDLSARLPYGVKGNYQNSDDELLRKVTIGYHQLITACGRDGMVLTGDLIPYLFPLSNITYEQIMHSPSSINVCDLENLRDDNDWADLNIRFTDLPDLIDWLNRNHFDYRGLIEKGLAIDATGLNIY